MNSTNLTIIIAAADQAQAQTDTSPDYFNAPASATGTAPATHYFTQGHFLNTEVDTINNKVKWDSLIRGPEWQQSLAGEGLQMITPEQPNAD